MPRDKGEGMTPSERDEEGIPIIPKLPPDYPKPCNPNQVIAICGECGIRITQVMNYHCSNSRCPTGLGGSTC